LNIIETPSDRLKITWRFGVRAFLDYLGRTYAKGTFSLRQHGTLSFLSGIFRR